jgi:hypothetical protein
VAYCLAEINHRIRIMTGTLEFLKINEELTATKIKLKVQNV